MVLAEALKKGIEMLKSSNVETPVVDAGVLLCSVIKRDRTFLYSHPEYVLNEETAGRFFDIIQKRASGMPVQYLTGYQEFMSLDFVVAPGVLIPRQDTEILVETVLQWEVRLPGAGPTILDIGTGSGCIAVSLAYYLNGCSVTAADISENALEIARLNATRHGVGERIVFLKSDLFTGLKESGYGGPYDMIVSNPPYIPADDLRGLRTEVRDYEPGTALFGGVDGLDFYRAIVKESGAFLRPGGLLAFEVGIGQADAVYKLMEKKYYGIRVVKDLGGIERVVAGTLGS